MNRVRQAGQYDGAVAEIEAGGTLVRHGHTLTIGSERGKKGPDFFCEKDGCKFLAEVKTLMVSDARQKSNPNLTADNHSLRPDISRRSHLQIPIRTSSCVDRM